MTILATDPTEGLAVADLVRTRNRIVDVAAEQIRAEIAGTAQAIDAGEASPTAHFPTLHHLRVLDLGVDALRTGRADAVDVTGSARLIALVAEECMSTAFSLWAHRVVLDFLARGRRSPATDRVLEELRSGRRVGSTAMASGLKALAGIEPLGVTGRLDPDGAVIASGSIRWASNLLPGSVVVLPIELNDGRKIVAWAEVGDAGLTVRPVSGLLALNATASASIAIEDLRIPADHVVSEDFASFVRAFRPTFLVLQSSFCVGVARRSLREAEALIGKPGAEGLRERYAAAQAQLREVTTRWERLSADVSAAQPIDFVRLRLDSSLLAGEATRLEAALAGGRGYLATSGPARRFREAAFLPVQSPSEGQLRWEISSLASSA
ncbi:acyl-CoA dehydrogenase family protein [Actinomycetota bacterium]